MPLEYHVEEVWLDKPKVEEEEYRYQVWLANDGVKPAKKRAPGEGSGVAQQIKQAREQIHQTLQGTGSAGDAVDKIHKLEKENEDLRKLVNGLVQKMSALESRLTKLEGGSAPAQKPASQQKADAEDEDDDDSDIDLFGSEDEEEAEVREKMKQERVAAYEAKKSKKPAVIAKSSIVLDVKPWDDETDMGELEKNVRSVKTDGLVWGASKLVKVAFGIMKLQISCVVEDDKVGTDFLEEEILNFEDLIQSVDIVAFNKI